MYSKAWEKLTSKYGTDVTLEELSSLALIIADKLEIELSDAHLESLAAIFEWFDENYERVFDFIDKHVVIYDGDNNIINDSK